MGARYAPKLIAAILALLLLSGCAEVLGPIKRAAGLSKAPPPMPEPPPPSSSSRQSRPRSSSAPEFYRPESSWPDYYSPPDQLPGPNAEPKLYYNGYLGLSVTVPVECYTDSDWYVEIWDPAILTERAEDSISPDLFDWSDDYEGGGYTLSMIDIDYYTGEYEYGYYSMTLDYYPDMTEQEYFAHTEAYLEEDNDYDIYDITASDTVVVNGIEYRHYTLETYSVSYRESVYTEEYFIVPVKDMYLCLFVTYPQESIEAKEISLRLIEEVCKLNAS